MFDLTTILLGIGIAGIILMIVGLVFSLWISKVIEKKNMENY